MKLQGRKRKQKTYNEATEQGQETKEQRLRMKPKVKKRSRVQMYPVRGGRGPV
jgi:hypothetical protein